MLLGHDGDLAKLDVDFTFDAPADGVSPNLSVFGMGISPTGNIKAEAHLHAGYDTKGLRDFFTKLGAATPNDPAKPEQLLDGFHIKRNDGGQAQFSLSGFLGLEAGVSVGLLSFSVQGGIFTGEDQGHPDPININLHDPTPADGKLRLSEIGADGCVFDAHGKLKAGVGVTVKVGVKTPLGFVGFTKTFGIAEVTLFSGNGCLGKEAAATSPPIIAGVDTNGTMTLFLGVKAGQEEHQHLQRRGPPRDVDGQPRTTIRLTHCRPGWGRRNDRRPEDLATGDKANQTITIQEESGRGTTGGLLDDDHLPG